MTRAGALKICMVGRSPHGERGLKYDVGDRMDGREGRSPHGERGLKFADSDAQEALFGSLSSWRAWIEMMPTGWKLAVSLVALLMESVD